MNSKILYHEQFEVSGGDFFNAGKASSRIKAVLKEIGIDLRIVRRVAIVSYEAEMNIVLYADNGVMELVLDETAVNILVHDRGPGIRDIELAMQEGYTTATPEMQEMGFGAGMGLPNIKKNADLFEIESEVGKGTELRIMVKHR